MSKKRLAWILLPALVVAIVALTLVLSNFQKEMGIAEPGKGGVAAVAAVAEAQAGVAGSGAAAYDMFSKSLAVAVVETRNMPITNAAETRLRTALDNTLDCLLAAREAWQADLEQAWDPAVDGSAGYWQTLHPSLQPPSKNSALSAADVREWAGAGASFWLQKALALTE